MLHELDLAPDDVVAFEDTEAGVAAALGAGLRCLAVRGTLPDGRLAAADDIVDRIDVELVRSLVG
jgi:beta-phosphoglucomutase-like phosphatase (HAD superfamily)